MKNIQNILYKVIITCFIIILGEISYSQINHTLKIKEVNVESYHKDSNFLVVTISDFEMTEELGKPSLPIEYLRFALPRGMSASNLNVEILDSKTKTLNKLIIPSQHPIPTSLKHQPKDFIQPDTNIYFGNGKYPKEIASIIGEGYLHGDIPIVTVAVTPIQYYPKKNEIKVLTQLQIELTYGEDITSKAITRSKSNRELTYHEKSLKAIIDNDEDVERFDLNTIKLKSKGLKSLTADYEYIIITSEELAPHFNEFIAWKKRKGIDIELFTVEDISSNYTGDNISGINDEAGKIRQFLYESYRDYGLEYALLGGDNTVVPIRYGLGDNNTLHYYPPDQDYEYYIPADLYFAEFNGDWKVDGDTLYGEPSQDDPEYDSEISVGRILCNSSTDIHNWTKKLIKYETDPGSGSTSYLTKSLIFQSDDNQYYNVATSVSGSLVEFTHTLKEELPSYNSIEIPTYPTGIDGIDEMNENYGLISWMSHAGPEGIGIGTKGNNLMGHNYKYNICALNSWDEDDSQSYSCIEEDGNGLDNMENTNFPSIVYTIGCSTTPFDNSFFCSDVSVNLGQGWTTNTTEGGPAYLGNTRIGWLQGGPDLQEEWGYIIDNGTSYHLGEAEALSKSNYFDHFTSYTHNLVGCPETEIWTSSLSTFTSASVTENGTSLTVSAGTSGSDICVMSVLDNGNSYHNLQPNVTSYTFPNVPFQYLVTITKHNYKPYIENPDTTYVQNISMDDTRLIYGDNIRAGNSVTQSITTGDVTIEDGSSVIFDASNTVKLEAGFEVELGAEFAIK